MNKKYLKENNLYDAHKHFMRLAEWSNIHSGIMQEDDDDMENDGQGDMGGDPNGGMGEPPMDGTPQDGGQAPMGEDPNAGMDMPPMDGFGNENMGEEDDVIDVDDLTNAQERVNTKVNTVGKNLGKVDDKIQSLIDSLNNIERMINKQNSEIETLKNEFDHRNPLPTERLNLRSLDSYPFNIKPTDYWADKGANSNYSAYGDNDESTTEEYEITNNDVDNFDEREMEKSFIPDEFKQSINKIFGL